MTEETVPWWMAGGLAAFWVAREAWGALLSRRKERTETDANVDLLTRLYDNGTARSISGAMTHVMRSLGLPAGIKAWRGGISPQRLPMSPWFTNSIGPIDLLSSLALVVGQALSQANTRQR